MQAALEYLYFQCFDVFVFCWQDSGILRAFQDVATLSNTRHVDIQDTLLKSNHICSYSEFSESNHICSYSDFI